VSFSSPPRSRTDFQDVPNALARKRDISGLRGTFLISAVKSANSAANWQSPCPVVGVLYPELSEISWNHQVSTGRLRKAIVGEVAGEILATRAPPPLTGEWYASAEAAERIVLQADRGEPAIP